MDAAAADGSRTGGGRGPRWRRLSPADGEGGRRRDRPDHPPRHLSARRRLSRRRGRPRRRSRHRRPASGPEPTEEELQKAPADDPAKFVDFVAGDVDATWKKIFAASGKTYEQPIIVLYDNQVSTACGNAPRRSARSTAERPQGYLDISFMNELQQRLGARELREAYRRPRDRASRPEPARRDGGRQSGGAGEPGGRQRSLGPARGPGPTASPGSGPARPSGRRICSRQGDVEEALDPAAAIRRRPDPEARGRHGQPGHVHARERWAAAAWAPNGFRSGTETRPPATPSRATSTRRGAESGAAPRRPPRPPAPPRRTGSVPEATRTATESRARSRAPPGADVRQHLPRALDSSGVLSQPRLDDSRADCPFAPERTTWAVRLACLCVDVVPQGRRAIAAQRVSRSRPTIRSRSHCSSSRSRPK